MSVFVFGDSVAKGVVYDEVKNRYRFIKESFINLLSKEESLEVKNYAKFGCTVIKGKEILEKNIDILEENDFVILEFGGNDCNYDWKEISENPEINHDPYVPADIFKKNYRDLIKLVEEKNCNPVLLSLPPLSADRFLNWVSKDLSKENIMKFVGHTDYIYRWHELYNSIIFDIAQEEKIPILDIRKAFLPHRNYEDYICIDGMHPNEKGHKLINDALLDYGMIPVL